MIMPTTARLRRTSALPRVRLPTETPVAALLASARTRAGLSQNGLAHAAGVDPAYVNRIEHGRAVPSRHVLIDLWAATDADDDELDRALAGAGYLPLAVTRAGGWDAYLRAQDARIAALEQRIGLRDAEIRRLCRELLALRRVG